MKVFAVIKRINTPEILWRKETSLTKTRSKHDTILRDVERDLGGGESLGNTNFNHNLA